MDILILILQCFLLYQALLNYVRSGFRIDVYWQTLNANGLTKDILASYDHPIVSEPHFRTDAREGLLRDLTSYLKTLKVCNCRYYLVIPLCRFVDDISLHAGGSFWC